MDLDSIEGLNKIRPSVYRVAMKLLSLQGLCHLGAVPSRHIMAAFQAIGRAPEGEDLGLSRQEVTQAFSRIFQSVSYEEPSQVYPQEAPEEASELLLMTFDQAEVGGFSQAFLQTVLVALSSDHLISKYRALLAISQKRSGPGSGLISRSGLRNLLTYLSKIPAVVQEGEVFGAVVDAVDACFEGVTTSSVSVDHAMSWLKSEPRLLLWLPTLYRLSVTQNVQHRVRCHTCGMFPITGLRYRCLKCVNVHVCQSCFLSQRGRRKHKKHHPLMEYCTPVTWTESLSSLMRRARHMLSPQRRRQREDTKESGVPEQTEDRPPAGLADADVCHSCRSTTSPCPPLSVGQSLEDSGTPKEQVVTPEVKSDSLRSDIINLQRDKWLLEQEVKAWRLTVQSEHGLLEDRCYQMEVTMETLRQQNLRLQGVLSQTLTKLETKQQALTTDSNILIPQTTTDPEDKKDQILPPKIHRSSPQTTFDHEENQSPSPTIYSETLQNTSDPEDQDQSPSPTIHWDLDPEDQDQSPSPTIHQGEHRTVSCYEEDQSPSPTIYCETLYINSDPEEHDQSPGPTIHQGLDSEDQNQSPSPRVYHGRSEQCVQRSDDDAHERFYHQIKNEVAEDDGKCSAEEQVEKTVEQLKKELEVQRHTDDRSWVELVVAAEQVGGAVHSLVDALMWDSHRNTQVTETFNEKMF